MSDYAELEATYIGSTTVFYQTGERYRIRMQDLDGIITVVQTNGVGAVKYIGRDQFAANWDIETVYGYES